MFFPVSEQSESIALCRDQTLFALKAKNNNVLFPLFAGEFSDGHSSSLPSSSASPLTELEHQTGEFFHHSPFSDGERVVCVLCGRAKSALISVNAVLAGDLNAGSHVPYYGIGTAPALIRATLAHTYSL
jgi:hypothetical protein